MRASDGFSPFRPTLILAIALAAAIWLAAAAGQPALPWGTILLLVATAGLGGWAGVVDARSRRLPDAITIPFAGAAASIILATTVATGDWARAGQALLGAGALGLLYLAAAVAGGLGLGDVKLAAILGATLGFSSWEALLWGSLLGLLLAIPHAVILHSFGRQSSARIGEGRPMIPLGPYMVLGAIIGQALPLLLNGHS